MAIYIDCKNLTTRRQKENNDFIQSTTIVYKCRVDYIYAKGIAGRISKATSRQSTKDETYILEKCNEAVSRVGIQIENLSTTAFRPTRDGRILSKKSIKNLA